MPANNLNKYLGYIDRSYEQIKASLISQMQIFVPEVTDYSESNILVVMISQFSAVAEMLNYYIDNWARESYLEVAQLFSSGYKLTRLTDYRTKSYIAATVDVTFTIKNADVNFPVTVAYTIPAGTIISTQSGIKFVTVEDAVFNIGDYAVTVGARQGIAQSNINLGSTTGVAEQRIAIVGAYSEGTMSLQIGADYWDLVDTMAFSSLLDKHYITEVYSDGLPYIKLGGTFNGVLPAAAQAILGSYDITVGSAGNDILPGAINVIDTVLTLPTGSDEIEVSNPLAPSGGADIEDLESIRLRAPLDVRTLTRAVTFTDFPDLLLLLPGVKHAALKYCCGIEASLYIAPNGGGIASSVLLDEAREYMKCKKIFTITDNYYKAGITQVVLMADVYGKYRFTAEAIYAKVETAVEDEFGYDASEINRQIRLSDIIGEIEKLPEIDYLDNLVIYTIPYARPLDHDTELSWDRITKSGSTIKLRWRLIYGATGVQIYKGDVYIATYPIGDTYSDLVAEFTILAGVYTSGMTWEFYTYPYNDDLEIDDYTVPIIDATSLIVTAHSQNKSFTCKPDC